MLAQRFGFNRDIVECKAKGILFNFSRFNSFNRDIVECKEITRMIWKMPLTVLIET